MPPVSEGDVAESKVQPPFSVGIGIAREDLLQGRFVSRAVLLQKSAEVERFLTLRLLEPGAGGEEGVEEGAGEGALP